MKISEMTASQLAPYIGPWCDETVACMVQQELYDAGYLYVHEVPETTWIPIVARAVRRAEKLQDEANAALLAEAQRLLTTLQGMAIHPSHYAGLAGAVRRATGGA